MSSQGLVEDLVVDTTAFIENARLHEVGKNIITCQEVINEVKNRSQIRDLSVLPYTLIVKSVFQENIKIVTDFAKKTGDFTSLSATDIKVIALTYQLEKEKNGIKHLRTEPVSTRPILTTDRPPHTITQTLPGWYYPDRASHRQRAGKSKKQNNAVENSEASGPSEASSSNETSGSSEAKSSNNDAKVSEDNSTELKWLNSDEEDSEDSEASSDDDFVDGWITPDNVEKAKSMMNPQLMEEKHVSVACMTTDFAAQNVLKQMNLNLSALNGKMIKEVRTYIFRCYTCFNTTSNMTLRFCPKCAYRTLKKVAVTVDDTGKMQIYINPRRRITAKGKNFSQPRIKGGKHPNNPWLVADQPMPDNKPSKLARTKNNPLNDDYIAGSSPFVMRDVNSRSARLGVRHGPEVGVWMAQKSKRSQRKRK